MSRLLACLSALVLFVSIAAAESPTPPPPPKFEDFDKVVAGAKTYEGLLKLYQKDEHVLAELQPHQLDHPFLCAISLARGGMVQAGWILNGDEQWFIAFKPSANKIHLTPNNDPFKAPTAPPPP